MKHRIFELYKPRSLEEFLTFYKENPKETFVYVLQHPAPQINILSENIIGKITLYATSEKGYKNLITVDKKKLDLPVTDIIRWKDEKFIDHIEKSIFR